MGCHKQPSTERDWESLLKKTQALTKNDQRAEALKLLRSADLKAAPPKLRIQLERDQASIDRALGNPAEADKLLVDAIETARSMGDLASAASSETRRAAVLIDLKSYTEAAACLDRIEAYEQSAATQFLRPYVLHQRGKLFWHTNRFEEALPPLRDSVDTFRERKQNQNVANVLVDLAWCHYRLGQYDKARALYEELLPLASPADKHLSLGHLGNIAILTDTAEAAKYYRLAAPIAKNVDRGYYALWLTNLAAALTESKRWDEAERANREAAEVVKNSQGSLGREHVLINSGRIAAGKGNYAEAERIFRQVSESRDEDVAPKLEVGKLLALVYDQQGRVADAQRQFDATLALAEASRARLNEDESKLSFLAAVIGVNEAYVRFLMDHGREEDALVAGESSRARLLRDRLNASRSALTQLSAKAYQDAARKADVTFVVYWVAPRESYVWTIDSSGIHARKLPPENELAQMVEQHRASMETPQLARAENRSRKLADVLLGSDARPGGAYIIVPDGPLCALSFDTLPIGGRSKYWIQEATIAVAPSLDLLLTQRSGASRPRSLLAIGDAVEWRSEYPRLINAGREIESIQRTFSKPTILTGAHATAEAFEQSRPGDYTYVHFAAHAVANHDFPLESAIILSPSQGKGELSVRSVLSTPIQADLVTLSACRSAGARTYAGEGLVGLAWAFLQSGAHAVVAGLWNVNDYASPKLMQSLYASIAAGKGAPDALREAKLKLLAEPKFADPYYWAPLQLYLGTLPTSRLKNLARN